MWDLDSWQWFVLMAVLIYGYLRFAGVPLDVCCVYVYAAIQLAAYPVYYFTLLFLAFIVSLLVQWRRFAARS